MCLVFFCRTFLQKCHFQVELETIRCRYEHHHSHNNHQYAQSLLDAVKLLLGIGKNSLFAGYVKRYQTDILTACIHLRFGKLKGEMFANSDQGRVADIL